MDAFAQTGGNPAMKHEVQAERRELADWRGTGRPNPSRETKLSSANGDREEINVPCLADQINNY